MKSRYHGHHLFRNIIICTSTKVPPVMISNNKHLPFPQLVIK